MPRLLNGINNASVSAKKSWVGWRAKYDPRLHFPTQQDTLTYTWGPDSGGLLWICSAKPSPSMLFCVVATPNTTSVLGAVKKKGITTGGLPEFYGE